MKMYNAISLLSDFGHVDEFVGEVKSAIFMSAPTVTVIDISHEIAPHDVRAASLMLVRSAAHLAPGVVIASVGNAKRYIAVEIGDGESVLLGPDNGIFAPVVSLVGGASMVVELETTETLFAARDVLAPAAAQVCQGVDVRTLGRELDPAQLVPSTLPFADVRDGVVQADTLHVNRYGNVHVNVTQQHLRGMSSLLTVAAGPHSFDVRVIQAFVDLPDGETGLLFGSGGFPMIVMNEQSAAEVHQLDAETSLSISNKTDL